MKFAAVITIATGLGICLLAPVTGEAAEKINVAVSHLGLWDTTMPTFCDKRGVFTQAGLEVEIVNTAGGSDNVNAVASGGADVGISPGVESVITAYAKGVPVRIISSEFIGQNDTYMYVLADSPLKSWKDINGHSLAFPRPGGAGETMLKGFLKEKNINAKLVQTGGISATRTMVMTGQIDVGWSVPPFGLDAVESGETRVLFSGGVVDHLEKRTGRVNIARADFLKNRRDVAVKFMKTLNDCIDLMYANMGEAEKIFAEYNKVTLAIAKKSLVFYPREALAFTPIRDIEGSVQASVESKYIEKPLTETQLKELIDIVYDPKK